MSEKISVVVCTYNRADMLKRALYSLIQQTLDKSLYEIIVIDNASTFNIAQVVNKLQANYPENNILLVREDLIGLGHARNTGIRHARGDYIAFIDDDAQANADWLEQALRCSEQVQPTPLGIGGPILPLYDAPKPQWFKDDYEIRTWGDKPRFLHKGESFSGSNMAWRKEILETFGGFDVTVGVKGSYLSVGEETALFDKVWSSFDEPVFFYSPQLVVHHWVPPFKMTVSYRLKRAFAWGQSWYLRYGPRSFRGRARLFAGLLLSVAKLSISALTHMRKYSAYQNWMVERLAPIAGEIGRLAGCLGLFIPVKQR
jgi:glycosyltransferase involved in cell wall biosynthesis